MSHWYHKTEGGEVIPKHFVEMASRPGELRPTRITDVRRWWREGLEVVPSVTTVLDVLAKHALVNWKIDQHLKQAYRLAYRLDANRDHVYNMDEYICAVKRATEMEMDKAPKAGTNLHKSMEKYFTEQLPGDHSDYELCRKVAAQIAFCTGRRRGETEVNFVKDGYGGQVDLVIGDWVIDYKTKQTADKFKPGKMAYDEHVMQLAAYREGLGIPFSKAANVFVCLEDGQVNFHEHTEYELGRGWKMFNHAFALWQWQNNVTGES